MTSEVQANDSASADSTLPVTVVVTRRVRRGMEEHYERRLAQLLEEAATLGGYLGATVQPPQPSSPLNEYTSVFRFATVADLHEFERSEPRGRFLRDILPSVEADATWDRLTGLEFWFTPPPGTVVPQPSRFRMAVLMIVVVFALVMGIGGVIGALLYMLPVALRLLITIVIEVLLMTYVLMPVLTRRLAWWIYPSVR